MNELEKILAEYHHDWQLADGNTTPRSTSLRSTSWQLATTTAKRQNQNRTSTPNRSVGQAVPPVRHGQDRPQIRDSGFTAKERIEHKEKATTDCLFLKSRSSFFDLCVLCALLWLIDLAPSPSAPTGGPMTQNVRPRLWIHHERTQKNS